MVAPTAIWIHSICEGMRSAIPALIAAMAVPGLVLYAAPPAPTPTSPSRSPSPAQAAPSESPASDSCAKLTAAGVRAAIAALPGWSYDFWSTSETPDGPQDNGAFDGRHGSCETGSGGPG